MIRKRSLLREPCFAKREEGKKLNRPAGVSKKEPENVTASAARAADWRRSRRSA
jgi:hypothetical protein